MSLLKKHEKVAVMHKYDDEMKEFAELYKSFLDECKTERETVNFFEKMAKDNGFKLYKRGSNLKAGDKIYTINRSKAIILAVIGKKSLNDGCNITAAHVDTPRIDIRTVPLYEDSGLALMKTHYYGGIKKYHWLAIPLEIRGVVYKKDGEKVDICIGKDPTDPVFTITDLLPHLGKDQMDKKATEIVKGEGLNVLVSATPSDTDEKENVKLFVLEFLNKTYGIIEDDFATAELSLVPAFNARDIGFDRTMVGAYGHDDRVCSYSTARALFDMKEVPEKTCVCALVDKEEIGSYGLTGMKSQHFDTFIEDLCIDTNSRLRVCYENSFCMSADVSNSYDPNFPDVSEKNNDSKISNGFAILKYTGARGKSGTSDASAETMSKVRTVLDNANVSWQTGQLGRVDQGGGGTVAYMISERNIETVDAGVPVLSMHAPFEVISKLDLYMSYKGYKAMFENM
ncbi:MAG: aminopeptidase [Clostridia bacterium]